MTFDNHQSDIEDEARAAREAMALHLWDEGLVRPESLAFAVVDEFIKEGWASGVSTPPAAGVEAILTSHVLLWHQPSLSAACRMPECGMPVLHLYGPEALPGAQARHQVDVLVRTNLAVSTPPSEDVRHALEAAAQRAERGYLYGEDCDDIARDIRAMAVPTVPVLPTEPEPRRVCTCWRLRPDGSHGKGCMLHAPASTEPEEKR